jgi:hypothetical protein
MGRHADGVRGPEAAESGVAICVDLDGTLVKSDTLIDSVLSLARQHPRELVKIPGWIAQGRPWCWTWNTCPTTVR